MNLYIFGHCTKSRNFGEQPHTFQAGPKVLIGVGNEFVILRFSKKKLLQAEKFTITNVGHTDKFGHTDIWPLYKGPRLLMGSRAWRGYLGNFL